LTPQSTTFSALLGAVLCTLLALPLCVACSDGHAAEPAAPPNGETWLTPQQAKEAKLELQQVAPHELANIVTLAGKVTFSDLEVSHVFSPVTGRVTGINASLGQHVVKGQPLATLDSPDVGLAKADFQKAEAEMVAAKHNFDRQKELADAHAVSQRDFESAQDDFHKAEAELNRAAQFAKILHVDETNGSGTFLLRSPLSGEVISRSIFPGMEVQGQYGSGGGSTPELFTVGILDPILVLADVYEMDLAHVKVGDAVQVSVVAYPDRKFDGKVDWISGTLDPVSRTEKLRITLPNPTSELRPEMYATVAVSGIGQRLLAIPRAAVLHLGETTMAFKALGSAPNGKLRFSRVPITVNDDIPGDYVQVTQGLADNDTVVSSGALLLTNQ